jgi:Cu2+-exporting ATPase
LQNVLFSIEKSSEHPLADAITHHLSETSQFLENVTVENISGQGIKGVFNQQTYFIGNTTLLKQQDIHFTNDQQNWVDSNLEKAQTVVLMGSNGQLVAGIAIADKIKATSKKAIELLKKQSINVVMLTGDNAQTAKAVSEEVGIEEYHANVLPSDKAGYVKQLQQRGHVVAMVGDGINDSNALAQSDVSIAMGKGSDIAMDVAKMTIISSDLMKITDAIQLSKKTTRTIKQNLFWAFIYNLICIPIAAGILFPINGFLLDPMWAGAAMSFSSISVLINSLLLKKTSF